MEISTFGMTFQNVRMSNKLKNEFLYEQRKQKQSGPDRSVSESERTGNELQRKYTVISSANEAVNPKVIEK